MNQASFPLRSNKLKKKVESAVQFSGCCLSLYNPFHFWQEHQLAEWICETGLYRVCELPLLIKKTGCSGMYAAYLQSHLSYLSFFALVAECRGEWVIDWLAWDCQDSSGAAQQSVSAYSLSIVYSWALVWHSGFPVWDVLLFFTYETQYI